MPKGKQNLGGARPPWYLDISPDMVYFTHSRVRPFFSGCGRRLVDTLKDLEEGSMKLETLPQITILSTPTSATDGIYFSLNNRRLWVLKSLKAKGIIDTVRVRVKDALPRELEKYNAPHIGRTVMATIMNEHEKSEEQDEDEAEEDEADEKVAKAPVQASKVKKEKKVPLSADFIEKHLKNLKKVSNKGGKKAAIQLKAMIDELIDDGQLDPSQEALVYAELA